MNRVLAAVSALVDDNHRVVFDKDMNTGTDLSFITNKATNESIWMRRENNVWVIDAYVEADSDNEEEDFHRRE